MNYGFCILVNVLVSGLYVTIASSYNSTELETEDDTNEIKSYRGYKLIRVTPKNDQQLKLVQTSFDDEGGEIQVWNHVATSGTPIEVMVSPEKSSFFFDFLSKSGINDSKILINDLQEILNQESIKPRSVASSLRQGPITLTPSFVSNFFSDFQRIQSINSFLDSLASTYPNLASTQIIGKSSEGRQMKIIKIGSPKYSSAGRQTYSRQQQVPSVDVSNKPIFWIDAGIHAREWAAPPTALFIAHSLLSNYRKDPTVKYLLDTFDFHILPVANPDGYEYTHKNDRMWRKTRSACQTCRQNSRCRGVDPNRNWSFHWKETGASSNPCSETYAGPKAFSEPETQAMASYLYSLRNQIKVYVSFHAYSQMWLTPWGYTSNVPSNFNDLMTKARAGADAVASVYGTKYTVGSSTRVLYAAAGGSDDWALGVAGIPYAYTIELRPSSSAWSGFLLPKNQILPTAVEMYAGMKRLGVEVGKELKGGNKRIKNNNQRIKKKKKKI